MVLEPIGLSHRRQGSNTVEEEITVRTQVTDCRFAASSLLLLLLLSAAAAVVVKLKKFISKMRNNVLKQLTPAPTKVLIALTYNDGAIS